MHARVQYPESIEPLVQFIEKTPPARDRGPHTGKTAGGYRSSDHADGFGPRGRSLVRPAARPSWRPAASARRAVCDLAAGEPRRRGAVPAGPAARCAVEQAHPRPGDRAVTACWNSPRSIPPAPRSAAPPTSPPTVRRRHHLEGIEAAKEAFLKACSRGESNKADHLFLWLWDNVPAIEAFDLLMSVAIPKNGAGRPLLHVPRLSLARRWRRSAHEHLKVLMRPAVRYVARFPAQRVMPEIDALIEEHGLLDPHPAPAHRRR